MNAAEALTIVQFVQEACPAQKFSEYTPDIWTELLADLDVRDARTACVNLGKMLPFIGPPDIRREVARIRADRIRNVDSSMLDPHDVDPADLNAWLDARKERIDAIASGQPVTIEPIPATTRDGEELLTDTLAALPKMPPALPQADLAKKKLAGRS